MTTFDEAAKMMGAPLHEIRAVVDVPAGPKITMADGSVYLNLLNGADAEGKTGLMFFVAPNAGYKGNYPIYAPFFPLEMVEAAATCTAGAVHAADGPVRS